MRLVSTINKSFVEHFAKFVTQRPWLVLALALLVALAMGSGGQFIQVTDDYRVMFGEHNPQVADFNRLEETFSSFSSVLVAVTPSDKNIFTRENLTAVEDITHEAWQLPYSNRVDSLTNYSFSQAIGDELIVEPLAEDAALLDDDDLKRIKEIALNEPEIVGRLIAHDGSTAGVAVTFTLPDNRDQAINEIVEVLDGILEQARSSNPNVTYYKSGDVVLNHTLSVATQDDFLVLAPSAFAVVALAALVILQSILGTLSIMVIILAAVATTMGFAGWLGTVFDPLNSVVPIIIMAMSVAHSVHIVATSLNNMRNGLCKQEAIQTSLDNNFVPMLFTTLTTVIGFLSLNASDSPPFHTLGNFAAAGVLCGFIFATTLLPALLCILPLRMPQARFKTIFSFEKLGNLIIARRKRLAWAGGSIMLVLILGIPLNVLTDSWAHFFDDRYEFRRDTDFIMDNLSGIDMLEYTLDSGAEGGITTPEYLRSIDAFAEWFRNQPNVDHVEVFSDTMKRLNKNLHGDDPEHYRIPEEAGLASQYLLLYELLLPFGRDLNHRIDIAKKSTRMTVILGSPSSKIHRELAEKSKIWAEENLPNLEVTASGITMIFAYLSKRNIESMLSGTIIAMAIISIMLILIFKSVRFGLISLIPNFLPPAMAFGLWGYLSGEIGISSSVAIIVAFGIIVDDTIHFISRYLKARNESKSPTESLQYVFSSVGMALFTTTVVLALGFLVFIASGYVGSWVLGLLIAITIGFALVADFLLLPSLLLAIDRKKP